MFNFRIVNKRTDAADRRKNEYMVLNLKTNGKFIAKADEVRQQGSDAFINANIYQDGKIEILTKDKVVNSKQRQIPVYVYNDKGEFQYVNEKYEDDLLYFIKTGSLTDKSVKLPRYCEVFNYDVEGIKEWLKKELKFNITKKEMLELLSDVTEYINDNVDLEDYFQDTLDELKDCVREGSGYDELESISYGVKAVNENSVETYRIILYVREYDGYDSENVNESGDGFSSWGEYYKWKNS